MPLPLLEKILPKAQEDNDHHEFRPLLAEIEERPVSPLGRVTLWIILSVFLFFVAWTCWGEIDVVVSARGKLIPDGQIKIIQPLETGVVRQILVKEGQWVKKGQPLIVIDPSTTQPALEAYRANLSHMQAETARLRAASGLTRSGVGGTQGALLSSSTANISQQIQAKEEQIHSLSEQIKGVEVLINQNQALLTTSLEKQARLLAVQDIIAKEELTRTQNDITQYEHKVKELAFQKQQLVFQQAQLKQEMASLSSSFQTTNLSELSEKEKQLTQIQATIDETAFKRERQTLKAPVDGYVSELLIHSVGGVVTPAEKLLSIVPANTPLVIESMVLNKDIGFVSKNMPVSIKIDTFDFQKYGTIPGTVQAVGRDSHEDEKLGPVYKIQVAPKQNYLMVEGQKEFLSPGLSLTSEIKVGKRRIIEFFIYPLIKHLDEGMSVR